MAIQSRLAYNSRIEALRKDEYPMLRDEVYLDHAGMTIPAKSLLSSFANDISSILIGNPHSLSASSQLATSRIEDIRLRVLRMFNADPAHFDVVFVANATAGIKLVTEAFRAAPDGFEYLYHQSSHTSLVGVRQEAQNSFCLDDAATESWLTGNISPNGINSRGLKLFAYPAQSNLDGRRFPLEWCDLLRRNKASRLYSVSENQAFSLLDAAAYVSTSPLDLSDPDAAPDFTVLSFYKIFGFPDLGALIVRRQSAPILLNRKYFGGGTVDSVVCGEDQWHARKSQSVHEALEDGTLPIHNILGLGAAMNTHLRLFGSMKDVSKHTSYLTKRARRQLEALRHGNGSRVCLVYSDEPERHHTLGSGAVVAFNLQRDDGSWISLSEFQKLASLKGFHLRTGGICNPGGISDVLGLTARETKRNYARGFRCGGENDVIRGKPTGVIRISLGAMSTESDVDKFTSFICEFYCNEKINSGCTYNRVIQNPLDAVVEDIIVYPIKSCRGFHVPKGMSWKIRAEGLMWDREWCLVHRATGRALNLKRYPRMALLQPTIDVERNTLNVYFHGKLSPRQRESVSIPLVTDLSMDGADESLEWATSRVCDDSVSLQRYTSHAISDFFSSALEIPCELARFSPAHHGANVRLGKPRTYKHLGGSEHSMPGSFPNLPAASRWASEKGDPKILLSNESPILAINTSSLRDLNQAIESSGGQAVSAEAFRANLVIGTQNTTSHSPAYSEDTWSSLRIGEMAFKVLGPCQRCHMVCVDPHTGVKRAEPYVTLSKTRRFNGKVFFGVHLSVNGEGHKEGGGLYCALKVGDSVSNS